MATERTFIAVKPDGVQRGLVGEIISRFEKKGFQLVALKLVTPTKELAETHYAEHNGKGFFPGLVNFLTSGPVVAIVFQGKGVIAAARALIGATNPLNSAPGTIRGDFGIDVGRNIIHGSDTNPGSADREIKLWFTDAEIAKWTPTQNTHIYE
jgi:nucleoside-diphosphate kinase